MSRLFYKAHMSLDSMIIYLLVLFQSLNDELKEVRTTLDQQLVAQLEQKEVVQVRNDL